MKIFKKNFRSAITALSILCLLTILIGCKASESKEENELDKNASAALEFLDLVYEVSEDDRDEFAKLIVNADKEPEKIEAFLNDRFTSDKFELSDEALKELNSNRDTAFMLVRAINENTSFLAKGSNVVYSDSMKYYDYSFISINEATEEEETFKGTIRFEDGKIAHCEIGKVAK